MEDYLAENICGIVLCLSVTFRIFLFCSAVSVRICHSSCSSYSCDFLPWLCCILSHSSSCIFSKHAKATVSQSIPEKFSHSPCRFHSWSDSGMWNGSARLKPAQSLSWVTMTTSHFRSCFHLTIHTKQWQKNYNFLFIYISKSGHFFFL